MSFTMKICIGIRCVSLGILLLFIGFAAGQNSFAQNRQAESAHDSVQDERIKTNQDRTVQAQLQLDHLGLRVQALERDISAARGAGMALGGVLALLEGISLILHLRVRRIPY